MEYISNIGNYIEKLLSNINGFDSRWHTLITSKPLLFEDIDYFRVLGFINNKCTEEEIAAYKRGELRELYPTFEYLLMCNLPYYDRILQFCTMIFANYIRLPNDIYTNEHLENIPIHIELTPTQIWCCALSSQSSTKWEINYGWSTVSNNKKKLFFPESKENQSVLESVFPILYKQNKTFQKFVDYCSFRVGTNGFANTILSDKSSNIKLSIVCSKFTKSTTAIDSSQLVSLPKLYRYTISKTDRLNQSISECLSRSFGSSEEYCTFIFENEFYIFSKKFKMRIQKDYDRQTKLPYITKHYLSNSYECFIAESSLAKTIRKQIDWAKSDVTNDDDFEYLQITKILQNILYRALEENYKEVKCVRLMSLEKNKPKAYSVVSFSGVFRNVYIHEQFIFNHQLIHESKLCMSKSNAAKYLIDKGYYIFGDTKTVENFVPLDHKTIEGLLIKHFSSYCIPILQHMQDIINQYKLSLQEIIEVLLTRNLPDNKLTEIDKYTALFGNTSIKTLVKNNYTNTDSEQKKINNYYNIVK